MRILAMMTVTLITISLVLAGCTASPAITPSGTFPVKPAESASPAVSSQIFTGYLVDQKCGISGVDIQDGTDLTKNPEKHQLSCAMMPGCLASGFGLFIKQADDTFKFYKFDEPGSQMAIDDIINKTKRADNFLVEVNGMLNGDTIKVSSITEK